MALFVSGTFPGAQAEYHLTWDLSADHATLRRSYPDRQVWQGGLLPTYQLLLADGSTVTVKAQVDLQRTELSSTGGRVGLHLGDLAEGELEFQSFDDGLRFSRLEFRWRKNAVPRIITMAFGAERETLPPRRVGDFAEMLPTVMLPL